MNDPGDIRWIDKRASGLNTDIDGVVPARQARSEATFLALVEAGWRLLKTKTFDEMTIGDVAKAAGASVGSFYARFKDKETYFAFIQERAMSEVEARLAAFLDRLPVGRMADDVLVGEIARFWVGIYSSNRGVYRASFKHASSRPDIWAPFKRTGWKVATSLAGKLRQHLAASGRRLVEKDLRVALQFANGTLINAVINDPGPISIDDPEMEKYVALLLTSFLGLAPPRATRRKKSAGRTVRRS